MRPKQRFGKRPDARSPVHQAGGGFADPAADALFEPAYSVQPRPVAPSPVSGRASRFQDGLPGGAAAIPGQVVPDKRGRAPERRSRFRSWRVAVVSFLLGAVTWHLVGFWSFMTDLVSPEDRMHAEALLRVTPAEPKREERAVAVAARATTSDDNADAWQLARREAKACVELRLDRASRQTKAVPCVPIIRGTVVAEDASGEQGRGETIMSRSARLTVPLRSVDNSQ